MPLVVFRRKRWQIPNPAALIESYVSKETSAYPYSDVSPKASKAILRGQAVKLRDSRFNSELFESDGRKSPFFVVRLLEAATVNAVSLECFIPCLTDVSSVEYALSPFFIYLKPRVFARQY